MTQSGINRDDAGLSSAPSHPEASRGAAAAFAGYAFWGLVPFYWKQLQGIDAHELIAHRLVWSLVFVAAVTLWRRGLAEIRIALATPRGLALNALSSVLLTINWLVYVWAVNAGHVIECSLGYFLVPLINVALGRLVFREVLRPVQIAAILCAATGVAVLIVQVGRVPWIALTLAGSFGAYGLLRKQSPLGALNGLALETALLAPFAAGLLLWRHHLGTGALGHVDAGRTLLVLSSGVVTAIPLLLFAYGARRLRFTTLGLLQYVAPTLQFLVGWLAYHEPFTPARAWAFAFIWTGLACYTADILWKSRQTVTSLRESDRVA